MFDEIVREVSHYFTTKRLLLWGSGVAIFVVGLVISKALAALVGRIASHRAGPRHGVVLQRVSYYGFFAITSAVVLSHLGFDLRVLLGAAGVLTVAIGFAPNVGLERDQRLVFARRTTICRWGYASDKRHGRRGRVH
ncbi:MAG: hypothetical protein R3E66_16495 [bacterium]